MPGIGNVSAISLANKFSTLQQIAGCDVNNLPSTIPVNVKLRLQQKEHWLNAYSRMQSTLDACIENSVHLVTLFDDSYPSLLKLISNPPVILYVKGKLANSKKAVACIGTRTPSNFGEIVAERISHLLSSCGWTIISGLANGIDEICHETALKLGRKTVAVLANGLDQIYPASNASLASRIIETGGALVSEQPFGVRASGRNLVQRNRIQTGLSLATFIMQSSRKGGSIQTAQFALLQNRLLFAPVPTGKHALEAVGAGTLALTLNSGTELVQELKLSGPIKKLLVQNFSKAPPAIPINGIDDYASILSKLKNKLQDSNRAELEPVNQKPKTLFD